MFGDSCDIPKEILNLIPERRVMEIHKLQQIFPEQYHEFYIQDRIDPSNHNHRYCYNKYTGHKYSDHGKYCNSDSIVKFFKQKNWIHINPNFEKMTFLNSDGNKKWTSYNWVIVRTSKKLFELRVGLHKHSFDAELGIKHTLLALPDQIFAAGELRIVVPTLSN